MCAHVGRPARLCLGVGLALLVSAAVDTLGPIPIQLPYPGDSGPWSPSRLPQLALDRGQRLECH